jgi:hypothetical protein
MHRYLLIAALLGPGCAYRIGGGAVAGALDELGGKGRSDGVEGVTEDLVERALLVELGHQLGEGLSSGATTITPEQQAELERTIDSLLTVAGKRAGRGLRNEVSPELRNMVVRDIVGAFSDGLKNDLSVSLEATVDRVVSRAVISLRETIDEPDTRYILADVLRDSIYLAMREGQASPAVGETLRTTLTEDVLIPIESSVGGITNQVAYEVQAQADRTERQLKGVISVLVVILGVGLMLYMVRNRQVRRLQEANTEAERGLRSVDAALEQLDDQTRAQVVAKLHELQELQQRVDAASSTTVPPATPRRDDYLR